MFRDKVKVKLRAGKGGNGKVSFAKNRKPNGGPGGDGGDVYLEGNANLDSLNFVDKNETYSAKNGVMGSPNNANGAKGEDLIFQVPLITKIFDEDKNLIVSISEHKQRVLLLKGGRGGLGNYYYRGRGLQQREKFQFGKPGEELEGLLQLELQSDIVFIGYPNAGKSSILKALTNARPKIAPYAFTTLDPMQGRLDNLILMDLPGLIEGASQGKGLGTKFYKHTKSAQLVAHFISMENEDVKSTYETMREEMLKIGQDLYDKHEVVVLTKTDLANESKVKESLSILKKINPKIISVSIYDFSTLELLKKYFKESIQLL